MNWRKFFHLLCHQQIDRCYAFSGETLFVCARCLGIYIGFLVSFIWLLFVHGLFNVGLKFLWIALLFVPMGIDGITQLFGLRRSSNTLRFVTGYIAGIGTACLAYASFSILLLGRQILSYLPTPVSLVSVVFMFPFLYVLGKHHRRYNWNLNYFFNSVSILSLAILLSGIIVLYSVFLVKTIGNI